MGLCKYFEDNYEMFLERIEGEEKYECIVNSEVSVKITPLDRVVNNSNPIFNNVKNIKCKDCGEIFSLSIGEQQFYHKRGLCNPKRCKSCRKIRKSKAS